MRRSELLKHLEILGGELEKRGIHGDMIVTGGATMCLVHSARDAASIHFRQTVTGGSAKCKTSNCPKTCCSLCA